MEFRKLNVFICGVLVVLGMIVPSYAKETFSGEKEVITQDQATLMTSEEAISFAKKAVKTYFDISINDTFKQNISPYNGFFYWEKIDKNESISIRIDESRQVLEANVNKIFNDKDINVPLFSFEEAKKKADHYMMEFFPKEYKTSHINLDLSQYDSDTHGYKIIYSRYVNDVYCMYNSITIVVNSISGEVSGFSKEWDHDLGTIEAVDHIISSKEAEKIFREHVKMELLYRPCQYDYNQPVEAIKLVYRPTIDKDYFIDAKNKKSPMNTINSNIDKEASSCDISLERKKSIYKAKSKRGLNPSVISSDRAKKVMKQYLQHVYKEPINIRDLELSESQDPPYEIWQATFQSGPITGTIDINAKTEMVEFISQFASEGPHDSDELLKPIFTWEEGYEKAVEVISTLYPDKIMELETKQHKPKPTEYDSCNYVYNHIGFGMIYDYTFKRSVNNIPFEDSYISISINSLDGTPDQCIIRWQDLEFPKMPLISDKEALDIFFETFKVQLVYDQLDTYSSENKRLAPRYITGLGLQNNYGYTGDIDASSGVVLDANGYQQVHNKKVFLEKIKGHPNQKALAIMNNISRLDIHYTDLQKEVTLIDVIRLLNVKDNLFDIITDSDFDELSFKNISPSHKYYRDVQNAVYCGMLDNTSTYLYLDRKITREQLAEIIVNYIDGQIDKYDDTFPAKVSDVSKINNKYKSHVAICVNEGIMSLDTKGAFRPKDSLTLEDAVAIIYDALVKLTLDNQ
ncbi:S-layer homology domain-containing protein [Vallitalea pronyensis]|uniref:S-layer homology domain-containing protein n=1 Tax=Vallitalea pronyensis TaxID=1348613 RepID=A0A8J8MLF0_9FIRM|nr:S-layer homology domain-containing protein [Vallitalea pronyensis]QUI24017.1 S-layer homology domain-containing protein [Vallitalea pronyensis]